LIVTGGDTDRVVDVEAVAARREAALPSIEVGVAIVSILAGVPWSGVEVAATAEGGAGGGA
jgi:hypothetical protein